MPDQDSIVSSLTAVTPSTQSYPPPIYIRLLLHPLPTLPVLLSDRTLTDLPGRDVARTCKATHQNAASQMCVRVENQICGDKRLRMKLVLDIVRTRSRKTTSENPKVCGKLNVLH